MKWEVAAIADPIARGYRVVEKLQRDVRAQRFRLEFRPVSANLHATALRIVLNRPSRLNPRKRST
jgi:hypothetical protein